MLLRILMVVCVVLVALPALVQGGRGMFRRSGHYSSDERADRASLVVLVTVRLLTWLLVLALSSVTLLSAVGAIVKNVALPELVYVFFVLDLLLSTLILLTFGRRDRRPARRRATPARR